MDMPLDVLPRFPYGAVYFRKSNPPREDWARDYQTAVEDGMNCFRHWFLWSAIETAPGVFDWEEYDRQLDLAAEHGLKTVIAEMITAAPEWAYRRYAHARLETREGKLLESTISGSSVTGGFPGLCLDHDDYRAAAEGFLRELVIRYREHPGMGGYDVWNECVQWDQVCYCAATAERFRDWLRAKYGDLPTLCRAWRRYSFTDWEDVMPPRQVGPYPDCLDWLQFRIDRAHRLLRWRVELIRGLDPVHPITAHGIAATLSHLPSLVTDDWRAAAEVDSYGLTWGSCRHGDEPWKQMAAEDLIRAASCRKRWWHAEAYGGPLWMQPQVIDKPRDEGRIATPEDIRYWNMVSFMLGATGLFYLRWRPLLDGPLFGAFGPYGMDGSRTDRSAMASRIGLWVTDAAQGRLWRSRPVRGEVGIVVVPETEIFTYAQQGNTDLYTHSLEGVYRGFFDANIQADWVRIEHVDAYDVLYLPFPVMLPQAVADRLKAWVAAGGTLIAEGAPGYFDDRGHVSVVQPGLGLHTLFGVREAWVEFTPDLLKDLRLRVGETLAWGGVFQQAYAPTTGTAAGHYGDTHIAVVDATYGKGRTRLIGTMVGYGHAAHPLPSERPVYAPGGCVRFFSDILRWAGKSQHVVSSNPLVKARLHAGEGGLFLWVANPTRQPRPVALTLGPQWGEFSSAETLWGTSARVAGNRIMLDMPARNVAVLALA